MEKFRLEYEKQYRALKTSHENEKKLLRKCRDLNEEILGKVQKVQSALKYTQDDSNMINHLRNELEQTYKLLELLSDREAKSKQKMENLRAEVKHLNVLIQEGNNLSSGQTNTVHELLIIKDELIKG